MIFELLTLDHVVLLWQHHIHRLGRISPILKWSHYSSWFDVSVVFVFCNPVLSVMNITYRARCKPSSFAAFDMSEYATILVDSKSSGWFVNPNCAVSIRYSVILVSSSMFFVECLVGFLWQYIYWCNDFWACVLYP